MVRPKDEKPFLSKGWLDDYLDKFEQDHPIIATRYYVVEVTPGRQVRIPNGDGHGGSTYDWVGPSETRVSEYSDEKEACEKFIEAHEPDEGKTLDIRTEHLRRFTSERWT